jgi:uncharacterized protein
VQYEWDSSKATANLLKHGVDFVDAIGALMDVRRLEDLDDESSPGEERMRTIGMTRGQILLVVSTMRDHDLCRIISARRATKHEQSRYYADTH